MPKTQNLERNDDVTKMDWTKRISTILVLVDFEKWNSGLIGRNWKTATNSHLILSWLLCIRHFSFYRKKVEKNCHLDLKWAKQNKTKKWFICPAGWLVDWMAENKQQVLTTILKTFWWTLVVVVINTHFLDGQQKNNKNLWQNKLLNCKKKT